MFSQLTYNHHNNFGGSLGKSISGPALPLACYVTLTGVTSLDLRVLSYEVGELDEKASKTPPTFQVL